MKPKVVVYTTDYCNFCHAAIGFLQAKDVQVLEINVQNDQKTRTWLFEVTGQMTVPQIFIDDKPYGGFRDIQQLDRDGQLNKILGLG